MNHGSVIRSDPVFQQEGPWIFLHHDKKFIAESVMKSHYLIENYLWNWGLINSATKI